MNIKILKEQQKLLFKKILEKDIPITAQRMEFKEGSLELSPYKSTVRTWVIWEQEKEKERQRPSPGISLKNKVKITRWVPASVMCHVYVFAWKQPDMYFQ